MLPPLQSDWPSGLMLMHQQHPSRTRTETVEWTVEWTTNIFPQQYQTLLYTCGYLLSNLLIVNSHYRGVSACTPASSVDAFCTHVVSLPAVKLFWGLTEWEQMKEVWKWEYTSIPQSIPPFQSIFQFSDQRHLEDNTTTVPSVASSHWRSTLALYVFHPCCILSVECKDCGIVQFAVHAPVQPTSSSGTQCIQSLVWCSIRM